MEHFKGSPMSEEYKDTKLIPDVTHPRQMRTSLTANTIFLDQERQLIILATDSGVSDCKLVLTSESAKARRRPLVSPFLATRWSPSVDCAALYPPDDANCCTYFVVLHLLSCDNFLAAMCVYEEP